MDQNEIIEMAKKAGFPFNKYDLLQGDDEGEIDAHEMFEAFAKLVYDRGWMNGYTSCDNDNKTLTSALIADAVEEEREECAKVCEKMGVDDIYCTGFANAIRARSSATSRGEA